MFPTGVGMNRGGKYTSYWRGMFPTGVGMNRCSTRICAKRTYVPHRRGDEPDTPERRALLVECSPQAWG